MPVIKLRSRLSDTERLFVEVFTSTLSLLDGTDWQVVKQRCSEKASDIILEATNESTLYDIADFSYWSCPKNIREDILNSVSTHLRRHQIVGLASCARAIRSNLVKFENVFEFDEDTLLKELTS